MPGTNMLHRTGRSALGAILVNGLLTGSSPSIGVPTAPSVDESASPGTHRQSAGRPTTRERGPGGY
jgi:hypothetical protein